jgi:hypothetical protein
MDNVTKSLQTEMGVHSWAGRGILCKQVSGLDGEDLCIWTISTFENSRKHSQTSG